MELISKKLLRRAMKDSASRLDGGPDCSSIPKLALATGLSNATIGFLVTEGKSARMSASVDTATRICRTLGWDLDELWCEKTDGHFRRLRVAEVEAS